MPVLQPLEAPASLQPVDQSGIPWIGPRPVGDISQLPGGKEYIALVKDNNKTQRGFIESVADIGLKDIPFAGPGLEAPKLFGLAETARKIHEGRPVADQALVNLNLYLQENQRKEKNTIGGDVADILKTVFTWGVEFASMRVPIGWVAKAGTAEASVSAKVAKKMVEKSVLQLLEDNLKSQAMKQAGKQLILGARSAAIKGVAASILDVPRTLETAGYLQVNNILNGGNWSDTQAVLAGILDSSIQFGAQYAGQSVFKPLFGGAQGLIGANTRAYMASRGAKAATVLGNRPTAKTMIGLAATIQSKLAANPFMHPEEAIDFFRNAGYGGVAEQIFAVQPLTGFLEGLTGLRGDQAGIVNALRTGIPDLKTLKAEALAFMIPGAIAATKVHVAGGKYGAAFDRQMRLLHSVDPRYSEKGDVTRTTEQIEKFGTDISAMFKGEKENPSLWSLVFGKDFTKPGSLKDTLRDVHTRIRWNALEEVYNRAEAKQAGTGYEAVKRQAMDFARGQYAEVATGAEAEAIQKRVVRLPGGVLVQRPPAEGESLLSGVGLLVGDEGAVNKVLQAAEKNRLNPTEFVADDHPDFAQKVEDFGHLLQIHDPAERIKMYRTVKAMLDSGEYPEGIYHIGPLFYDVGDPKDVNSVVASIVLGTHRDGKLYISPLRDAAQNLPSNTSTLIHEALESRTPLEQLDSDPVMRDVDAGIATEIRRLRQMFPEDRRLEELESWGGTR